jgi:drug/metabolite transporter (DMT)-like permease
VTSTERAGLAFASAEILAVGLVPAFSKFAMNRVDPLPYSVVAVSVAAAVSIALAAGRGELHQVFELAKLPWLIACALLGTTATTLLLFFGARLTDGVSAALLMQAEPLYSLALTSILWRRRVPLRQAIGTGFVLGGILLVLWDGTLRVGLGGALILLAPLGWQLSHVLALRVMPPMSPYALTAARYLYGGAGLVVAHLAFGGSPLAGLGRTGVAMAVFHGVVLFFCGTLFWYETIRRLDLARATAIVTPCEPLMSLILVWVMLRTLPNAWQALGFALLAPGMAMLVIRAGAGRAGQEGSR